MLQISFRNCINTAIFINGKNLYLFRSEKRKLSLVSKSLNSQTYFVSFPLFLKIEGSDRIGSNRAGSAPLGLPRVTSDRDEADRLGSARFGSI